MCAKIRSFLLFAMVFMILPFAQASQDLTTTSAQDETFRQLRDASRKQDATRASRLGRQSAILSGSILRRLLSSEIGFAQCQ